ncbi:hypothetical protein [Flavobacterium sp. H122]|uniref:hypothetical protein n=1 Tax=Flavobacterium sp. H122 TaxID=2529860 RepID=UPI0010AA3BEF|nr:hypothetical protein [Flavobacterium sp. H122]
MSVKSSLTIFKIASVAFLSATFAIGVKYYDTVERYRKLQEETKIDKEAYANDLKEILNRYDAELQKNREFLASNGMAIKEEVVRMNNLYTVEKKIVPVQNVANSYLKKIDSFQSQLKKQNDENSDLVSQVSVLREKNKELNKKNSENETIIATSKNLTATNVAANGIKIVANNIIETKRFNATQQIKVCFTLLENKAAVKGNKDIYIQIVNPDGKVVTKNGEVLETKDKLLSYSARTNVYYDNEELDVCVFVDPNRQDITKGDYELNIYSGINLIGNTVFTLK